MDIRFDKKRALVTGAGKGIGRAIAKKLVQLGAETIALSRTQEDLNSLKKEVPGISIVNVDLQDWEKTRAEVSKLGRIDLLVNNAAVGSCDTKFTETPKDKLDMILDIDVKAVYNVSQIVAKQMIANGKGGSIVNISSIASQKAMEKHSVYCMSKAAVDMLTKCMALELGSAKIRVNAVNPTIVWTKMARDFWKDSAKAVEQLVASTPIGKVAEIEDIVDLTLFLLSEKSVMISGEIIRVDGGHGVH